MKKAYKGQIPFINGEFVRYVQLYLMDKIEWRDNTPFLATAKIDDSVTSGRSAKYLTLIIDGTEYPMFVKDFVQAVIAFGAKTGGEIEGNWCFCKRGENYGICAYEG